MNSSPFNVGFVNRVKASDVRETYPISILPSKLLSFLKESEPIIEEHRLRLAGRRDWQINDDLKAYESAKLYEKQEEFFDKRLRGLEIPVDGYFNQYYSESSLKKTIRKLNCARLNDCIRMIDSAPSDLRVVVIKNAISHFLNGEYFKCFKTSHLPVRVKNPKRKGGVEDSLLPGLITKFGGAIKIDTQVGPYFPDFVLQWEELGLNIDIEVDEILEKETNSPIHYIGADDERNEFFTENGWFVLRFTEEQAETPDKVCDFIEQFIQIVNPEIPDYLINKSGLRRIKRWTYEEAYMKAKGL